MKMLFIKATSFQSIGWMISIWLLMGNNRVMVQQNQNRYPPITKLCPGQGGRIFYAGRVEQVRAGQPNPAERQLILYLVPQGEPLSPGVVVGSAKEVVTYMTIYPPDDKNYRPQTVPASPLGRFDFSLPANLPGNFLNRPVQLRFDQKPQSVYTSIASTYTINPTNCP